MSRHPTAILFQDLWRKTIRFQHDEQGGLNGYRTQEERVLERISMSGSPIDPCEIASMDQQQGQQRSDHNSPGTTGIEAMIRCALEDDRGADMQ